MLIIQDSREQAPFTFETYGVEVVRAGLPTADYSLPGFQDKVGIERKNLDDLIGCLMQGRDRFEKELVRLARYDLAAVVVEAAWADLAQGRYRSDMKPHSACQSVLTFQVRYRVPFLFAGSRAAAEYVTFSMLAKYLREIEERVKVARKGQAA